MHPPKAGIPTFLPTMSAALLIGLSLVVTKLICGTSLVVSVWATTALIFAPALIPAIVRLI
ncbi:hypothetical protein D3C75_1017260 [compost metagenome]